MQLRPLLITATLIFSGCTGALPAPLQDAAPVCQSVLDARTAPVWFTAEGKATGVALVVHGLNNKPEAMNALIAELQVRGYHALRLTLSGHSGAPSDKHRGDAEVWLSELEQAFCLARRTYPDLPLVNVSYSLGAALSLVFVDRHGEALFDKMILLAPAIRIHGYAYLPRLVIWLQACNFSLPSRAPSEARAYPSTSLHSYAALYELIDALDPPLRPKKLGAIPVLIFADPDDELISRSRLKRWIADLHFERWKIAEIGNSDFSSGYRHLCLNAAATGDANWKRMWERAGEFLK